MTSEPIRNQIDEDRAAVLLGFTREQLRLLCDQSGLGHGVPGGDPEKRWFTYQELYRFCCCVVRPVV
jgi:hypothetical protein